MLHITRAKRNLIHITEVAKKAIKEILHNKNSTYLKLGVDSRGCSGLTYTMKTTEQKEKNDEFVDIGTGDKGLLIGVKAAYNIIGTVLDHETDEIGSRFTYKNPNITGSCGCGASFTTK